MNLGGGVFVAVPTKYLSCPPAAERDADDCEMVLPEVERGNAKKLYVGSCYRPEHVILDYMQLLDNSLSRMSSRSNCQIWLGGDFNVLMVNWENHVSKPGEPYKQFTLAILNSAQKHGLEQVVMEPTCIQGEMENILDLYLTNNPKLVN